MTIAETARKWFVGEWVVRNALLKGKIPGAVKVQGAHGLVWFIPGDAPDPIPPAISGSNGAQPKYTNVSDPVRFVQFNCNTQSIRWIARMLGITTQDVRDIYDQILREGGDDFAGEEELERSVC